MRKESLNYTMITQFYTVCSTTIKYKPLLWLLCRLDNGDFSRLLYVFIGSLSHETVVGFIAYMKGRGVVIVHTKNKTEIYLESDTTSVSSRLPRHPIRFLVVLSYMSVAYELQVTKVSNVRMTLVGIELGREQDYNILSDLNFSAETRLAEYMDSFDRGLNGLRNKPQKSYQSFIEEVFEFKVTLNVTANYHLLENNHEPNNN